MDGIAIPVALGHHQTKAWALAGLEFTLKSGWFSSRGCSGSGWFKRGCLDLGAPGTFAPAPWNLAEAREKPPNCRSLAAKACVWVPWL